MNRSRRSQIALAGALIGTAATLSACSGSTSTSASPSMTAEAPTAAPTTEAPTSSPGGGPCNAQVITAALPSGSKVLSFDCANVSGTQWAAVKVDPGPTVFFLQRNGSNWDVSMGDEICGTASAGLPEKLLAYCSDSGTGSDMSMSPGSDMDMSTDSSVAPS